ncbi:MAG TPA: hypothetical protein VME70_13050 [Mycobacteriales bacterium]|nr:hypothetical protein [Mycobacteriales bacterium]
MFAAAAAALCLFTAMASPAAAHAKGEKGDPQPEAAPFKLGTAADAGSVAIMPNGDLVVAWGVATKNHQGATRVCVLKRGGTRAPTTPSSRRPAATTSRT